MVAAWKEASVPISEMAALILGAIQWTACLDSPGVDEDADDDEDADGKEDGHEILRLILSSWFGSRSFRFM